MENPGPSDRLILAFASRFRVITLGGIAVISHGLNRNTHDADIWIDPAGTVRDWAEQVGGVIREFSGTKPVRIGSWEPFTADELEIVIREDKVFRVLGLDRPLDIFRAPNELEIGDFDAVWERGMRLDDGTRVPDVVDLLVTKQLTDRTKDIQDIAFLEAKAEVEYLAKLPGATDEEAAFMLGRFLTPKVAEAAMKHDAEVVRVLATGYLQELAEDGDPYARDILNRNT